MQFCFKKQCYFYGKKQCFNRNHTYVGVVQAPNRDFCEIHRKRVPRDTLILSRDDVFGRNERFRSVAFQNIKRISKLIIFKKVRAGQSWRQNRKSGGNRGIHSPFTKESSKKLSQLPKNHKNSRFFSYSRFAS